MLKEKPRRIINHPEAQAWLKRLTADHTVAVTLTLKQRIVMRSGPQIYYRTMMASDLDGITEQFVKKLNKQIFGSRTAIKYKKTISCLAVKEGAPENGTRLHIHMTLGNLPVWLKFDDLTKKIKQAASLIEEIYDQIDVQQLYSDRFTAYMVKNIHNSNMDNLILDFV